MRIQSINSFNFNKPVINQPQVARQNQLNGDIVSFSAKKKKPPQVQINHNIDFGVSIGDEILSKLNAGGSKEEIFSILQKRLPDVQIGSIDEIANKTVNSDGFVAYFDSRLNDDFTQTDRKMYLELFPFVIADNKQKLAQAMDIAHESTHAKQVDSGKDASFYKKLSNGDAIYAGTVIGIGKYVYERTDKFLREKMLAPCFYDFESQMNVRRYNREIPSVADVSRLKIIKNGGFENYDNFKEVAETILLYSFKEEMDYLIQNPQYADNDIKEVLVKINNNNAFDKFFDDIKKYCSYMAMNEYEARTTECKLAKKALKTNKTLNIDCYPIYYEMLSKALK